MKNKLCTLVLTIGISILSFSQDIIVTKTSERIDATIVEVSPTEVKYKSVTNPDGPLFVLQTSQIASIIYKSGDVQTFANSQQQSNTIVSVREAKDIILVPGQHLEKVDRKVVNDNDKKVKYYYGNVELDNTMYKDFLELNCPEAYKQYKKGHNMAWGGAVIGGTVAAAGALCLCFSSRAEMAEIGGLVGLAGAAVMIPCIVVGMKKQEKALDIFNESCVDKKVETSSLTISLIGDNNGLGLALNF